MELPKKLLQTDFSKFEGQYHKQPCIKVRNKQIQLVDILIRALCPDPEFGKVVLTMLSESFIFNHVFADRDQLCVELSGIYTFRITHAVARRLALLAGNEEYRNWHRGIIFGAGEALASQEGCPWRYQLPEKFKLEVTYSVLDSPCATPFYRTTCVTPTLELPYKTITIYVKNKSEVFRLS